MRNYMPEGIQDLIDLGIPIELFTREEGSYPFATVLYKGLRIRINYGRYEKTYHFGLFDSKLEDMIGYNMCSQIKKEAGLELPNEVHKPHKGRIEKHFEYLKKYHEELWKYYEKRDIERCAEIGQTVELMSKIKRHRIYSKNHNGFDMDSITFKSNVSSLTFIFSDFNTTRKSFEIDRYDIEQFLKGATNAFLTLNELGL